ncbi:hypothetical protein I0C86_41645 [Plantactinospora sp. S1510]|uniref:Uncharacterized protein n=1 Tax=Plantactinospora alkalitolerans TaxID=2789879 RepID=A0ABS0HA61_9ACTN|nr:hypothetical protein [Plantactinospora alkalitolerans]MBF9135358.1 hypothetical protein [Plantactinospora alkalitolerans]
MNDPDPTLVDFPTPALPPGTVQVRADELVKLLRRLAPFPGSSTAAVTLRYVWLTTAGKRLVGFASDTGTAAQATAQTYGDGPGLPLAGILPVDIAELAKALKEVDNLVQLVPVGAELIVRKRDDELARVPVRVPTSSDERFIGQLEAELHESHRLATKSSLPLGYVNLAPHVVNRFKLGRNTGDVWYAPHGRGFVRVDANFCGHFKPVGPTRSTRPTPTAPLHIFPATREAAA